MEILSIDTIDSIDASSDHNVSNALDLLRSFNAEIADIYDVDDIHAYWDSLRHLDFVSRAFGQDWMGELERSYIKLIERESLSIVLKSTQESSHLAKACVARFCAYRRYAYGALAKKESDPEDYEAEMESPKRSQSPPPNKIKYEDGLKEVVDKNKDETAHEPAILDELLRENAHLRNLVQQTFSKLQKVLEKQWTQEVADIANSLLPMANDWEVCRTHGAATDEATFIESPCSDAAGFPQAAVPESVVEESETTATVMQEVRDDVDSPDDRGGELLPRRSSLTLIDEDANAKADHQRDLGMSKILKDLKEVIETAATTTGSRRWLHREVANVAYCEDRNNDQREENHIMIDMNLPDSAEMQVIELKAAIGALKSFCESQGNEVSQDHLNRALESIEKAGFFEDKHGTLDSRWSSLTDHERWSFANLIFAFFQSLLWREWWVVHVQQRAKSDIQDSQEIESLHPDPDEMAERLRGIHAKIQYLAETSGGRAPRLAHDRMYETVNTALNSHWKSISPEERRGHIDAFNAAVEYMFLGWQKPDVPLPNSSESWRSHAERTAAIVFMLNINDGPDHSDIRRSLVRLTDTIHQPIYPDLKWGPPVFEPHRPLPTWLTTSGLDLHEELQTDFFTECYDHWRAQLSDEAEWEASDKRNLALIQDIDSLLKYVDALEKGSRADIPVQRVQKLLQDLRTRVWRSTEDYGGKFKDDEGDSNGKGDEYEDTLAVDPIPQFNTEKWVRGLFGVDMQSRASARTTVLCGSKLSILTRLEASNDDVQNKERRNRSGKRKDRSQLERK
ncbi:hypothetical protein K491DRAFT_717757 [Lophiostoma macrostomum CBS 122681]|uniref:Uncharacterized protein n=1 Tax=Lophiostoma macrostomum CBS 122681 TaxID=1314788 RepID=A0A6A6T283_9PLEO|nr:hypothetical protein K491DRAFT_717757 [Lophiostoma macrostomum CBS 122681]